MPRRHTAPNLGFDPGRMYRLEEELHALWQRRMEYETNRRQQEMRRREEAETQRRFYNLRAQLTGTHPRRIR